MINKNVGRINELYTEVKLQGSSLCSIADEIYGSLSLYKIQDVFNTNMV